MLVPDLTKEAHTVFGIVDSLPYSEKLFILFFKSISKLLVLFS